MSTALSTRDKILLGLDLQALTGVEIGVLTAPMVSRNDGNVIYVDHADTDTLRKKYGHDKWVDIEKIVEVDAVWGLQTLQQCIGLDKKVDYVIASHVIEHTPDMITWLFEIQAILKNDGKLRLVVPDRRFTFDYIRNESRLHDFLDAYIRRARAPLPRFILEHYIFTRDVDIAAAWRGIIDPESLVPFFSAEQALNVALDGLENGTYHDVHCWVFTPKTFAENCAELAKLGLLNFSCDYFFDTAPFEFEYVVGLSLCNDRAEIIDSWERMRESAKDQADYR